MLADQYCLETLILETALTIRKTLMLMPSKYKSAAASACIAYLEANLIAF